MMKMKAPGGKAVTHSKPANILGAKSTVSFRSGPSMNVPKFNLGTQKCSTCPGAKRGK